MLLYRNTIGDAQCLLLKRNDDAKSQSISVKSAVVETVTRLNSN